MPGARLLDTRVHVAPFQCRISGLPASPVPPELAAKPTAQASFAEVAATASRAPATLRLLAGRQAVPSQCRISVLPAAEPTAQALPAESAVTPERAASAPRSGLCVIFHVVPFQCKMRPSKPLPTAQASRADVADTATRRS
jgi:hypothetical protein